jgi:Kdo2-lipid IVA lauroyltransferase/acyltransferase
MFSVMPYGLALHTGDALGRLAHAAVRIRRREATENVEKAFPELSARAHRALVARLYRHLGRTLAEFCRYPVLSPKVLAKRVSVSGSEHLTEALGQGRGALLLTAHLGNWELLGAGLAARGFPMTFLVAPQKNKLVQDMFNRYRSLNGVEVIVTKGGDLRGVFRALKAGRVVATVADQDAGPDGHFLTFMGRPASAALGPFRIARRTGAPLVLAFDRRIGMRHQVAVEPPLYSDPSVDREEEAIRWAEHYHRALEKRIDEAPEQWFWVHRRWRTRPAAVRPEPRRPAEGKPAGSPVPASPAASGEPGV